MTGTSTTPPLDTFLSRLQRLAGDMRPEAGKDWPATCVIMSETTGAGRALLFTLPPELLDQEREKNLLLVELHVVAARHLATQVGIVLSAWAAPYPAEGACRPSEDPKRRDMVIIAAGSRLNGSTSDLAVRIADVDRAQGRPQLGPWEDWSSPEGRWPNAIRSMLATAALYPKMQRLAKEMSLTPADLEWRLRRMIAENLGVKLSAQPDPLIHRPARWH